MGEKRTTTKPKQKQIKQNKITKQNTTNPNKPQQTENLPSSSCSLNVSQRFYTPDFCNDVAWTDVPLYNLLICWTLITFKKGLGKITTYIVFIISIQVSSFSVYPCPQMWVSRAGLWDMDNCWRPRLRAPLGLAVRLGAKRVQGGERTGQSLAMSWPLDHNGVSANSRENCDEHFVLWSSVKTAEGRKQLSIRETLQQRKVEFFQPL